MTTMIDSSAMTGLGRHCRRGSAYVSVLGVSTIVALIGVTSLLASRVELRITRQEEAAVQAAVSAPSLIEVALLRLDGDPNWRTTYTSGDWTANETVGGVTYNFSLVDEKDGDLANDASQPVRLYAKATVGDAVRTYSVLLGAEGADSGTREWRVADADDDAEERSSDGLMFLDSSDLEFAVDPTWRATDTVGMRFTNVAIEQGTTIQNTYIQFQVDETGSGAVFLTIKGQDIDDAGQFGTSSYDISSRSTTSASVAWSPPAWNSVGEAGVDQRTPNITSILQEIVDRPGWSSGNALVIIITGTGTRWAESYDADASGAALLHVELGGTAGSITPVSGTWRQEVGP